MTCHKHVKVKSGRKFLNGLTNERLTNNNENVVYLLVSSCNLLTDRKLDPEKTFSNEYHTSTNCSHKRTPTTAANWQTTTNRLTIPHLRPRMHRLSSISYVPHNFLIICATHHGSEALQPIRRTDATNGLQRSYRAVAVLLPALSGPWIKEMSHVQSASSSQIGNSVQT